jgi:ABC-2 type transport system ATP-binding protein
MNFIQIENLCKRYGNTIALNDITFEINPLSIHGLIGPNGAGKSTLVKILNQILTFNSGRILFNGESLNPIHLNRIGYLPEERGLYKDVDVTDQLIYFARLKGLKKNEAKERINQLLGKFDIHCLSKKKLFELSKGMQQKVQFISSIIHSPSFLVLDEPLSGFDPLNAHSFKDEIRDVQKNGCTILISSHNMECIENLCDTITILNRSNIAYTGSILDAKIKYKTKGKYELHFIGEYTMVKTILGDKYVIENHTVLNDIHTLIVRSIDTLECNLHMNTNHLLSLLINNIQLISFKEIEPSIEDIFMDIIK